MLMSMIPSILTEMPLMHFQQATVARACSHDTFVPGSIRTDEISPAASRRCTGESDSTPASEEGTAEQPAAEAVREGAATVPRVSESGDAPGALHILQLRATHNRTCTGQDTG